MCAGAGGQALGLERAGFFHNALVELDQHACSTLRHNRPAWNVIEGDLTFFDGRPYKGIDLLAGGLPCPPFSRAGKQLGSDDERNLFPTAIRLVEEIQPKAVMIENVRGILDAVFEDYRTYIAGELRKMGYFTAWKLFQASDYGVPQLRPRVIFVALKEPYADRFVWPTPSSRSTNTVGETLFDLMAENGWEGARVWAKNADDIAPTLVGGSKKHGGPDLGPTRAKRAWAELGVDGSGIASHAPMPGFEGNPKLTVRMAARIQGIPDDWEILGAKTNSYRQVGNAFPPPVAQAVGTQIRHSIEMSQTSMVFV